MVSNSNPLFVLYMMALLLGAHSFQRTTATNLWLVLKLCPARPMSSRCQRVGTMAGGQGRPESKRSSGPTCSRWSLPPSPLCSSTGPKLLPASPAAGRLMHKMFLLRIPKAMGNEELSTRSPKPSYRISLSVTCGADSITGRRKRAHGASSAARSSPKSDQKGRAMSAQLRSGRLLQKLRSFSRA